MRASLLTSNNKIKENKTNSTDRAWLWEIDYCVVYYRELHEVQQANVIYSSSVSTFKHDWQFSCSEVSKMYSSDALGAF